jgi:quinol monooxygenase YgiN
MIRVIAILTAKPGHRDDILALFKANVPAVLQEKGCLEYGPVIDAEGGGPNQAKFGPDTFVVIETWESLEALDAHRVAPHMAAFGRAAKDMFASRTIHVLSPA